LLLPSKKEKGKANQINQSSDKGEENNHPNANFQFSIILCTFATILNWDTDVVLVE
jgi:hypothetical protein